MPLKSLPKAQLTLNGIAIAVYLIISAMLHFPWKEEWMMHFPDSVTYLDVAKWTIGGEATLFTIIRPVLYPFIMAISYIPFGPIALWLLQAFLWLLTINLTYLSLLRLLKSKWLVIFCSILLITNFSLIAATYLALAEAITTFFISLLLYLLSSRTERLKGLRFFHQLVLLLVLLTLLKPVYYIPLALAMVVGILFHLKKYQSQPSKLLWLLFLIAPILLQLTVMKTQHGKWGLSDIGDITFRNYFFAQGYCKINKIDLSEREKAVAHFTKGEMLTYVAKHPSVYLDVYYTNLRSCLRGNPALLEFPEGKSPQALIDTAKAFNRIYLIVHWVFLVAVILLLLLFLRQRNWEQLFTLASLMAVAYIIILTSGISAWQGDRLVLPAQPVWLALYAYTGLSLLEKWKKKPGKESLIRVKD